MKVVCISFCTGNHSIGNIVNENQPIHPMPFFTKFVELQLAMLQHNARLTNTHPYQSDPISWPFLLRGISFWSDKDKNAARQIYLLGNIWGWWLAGTSVLGYVALMLADTICRKRGFEPIEPAVRKRLIRSGGIFAIGYALHYFPFFLMNRQLFLHHYLPSAIFAYLLVGVMFEFCFVDGILWPTSMDHPRNLPKITILGVLMWFAIVAVQVGFFVWMRHMIYGLSGMTVADWQARQLLQGWDLAFLK